MDDGIDSIRLCGENKVPYLHRKYSNSLMHHGIKGQRWGIRRWQNKDGSLTPEGRMHYAKENYETINTYAKTLYNSYDKTKLSNSSERFNQLGSELADDYDDYYESLKSNSKFKEAVYKSLYKDLGNGCDDDDLFDYILEDHLNDELQNFKPKPLVLKEKEFFKVGDDYFDELKNISKMVVDKYGDLDVYDPSRNITKKGKDIAYELVAHNDDDSRWNSYMYRHYDDYWVNDVESRYDLENSFSMNEYNKRYAH